MSWFAKNFEKAALGGAVVVALGLGYLGWSRFGAVEEDFGSGLGGPGNNNDTAVKGAEFIPMAIQSMGLNRTWEQARDGDRPVDLFTGISLFVASSDPERPVDLLTDEPVHQPIPNTWWLENRLDPGFADSPARDPDGDGFSNLEEFKAGTDPNSARSFPPPIAKLTFVKDESLIWVLRPGYEDGGKFPFTYENNKRQTNRITSANAVSPEQIFFDKEPAKGRFKLIGSEVRQELNPRTQVEMDVTIVTIEDQRPNKKGVKYEFPSPLPDDERKNAHLKYDRTAVLSLEALGLNGKEFKVEENTRFALPPDARNKDYLLQSVTPEMITVEFKDADGKTRTVEIGKGGFPNLGQ